MGHFSLLLILPQAVRRGPDLRQATRLGIYNFSRDMADANMRNSNSLCSGNAEIQYASALVWATVIHRNHGATLAARDAQHGPKRQAAMRSRHAVRVVAATLCSHFAAAVMPAVETGLAFKDQLGSARRHVANA